MPNIVECHLFVFYSIRCAAIGRESTRGERALSLLAIKNAFQATNRSGEEGEEPALCYPGPELRLGTREKRRAETIKTKKINK